MSWEAVLWALDHPPLPEADKPGRAGHPCERAVLVALARYADKAGRGSHPAVSRVMHQTGLSEARVRAAIATLERWDVIRPGDPERVATYPKGTRPRVWDLAVERVGLAHVARRRGIEADREAQRVALLSTEEAEAEAFDAAAWAADAQPVGVHDMEGVHQVEGSTTQTGSTTWRPGVHDVEVRGPRRGPKREVREKTGGTTSSRAPRSTRSAAPSASPSSTPSASPSSTPSASSSASSTSSPEHVPFFGSPDPGGHPAPVRLSPPTPPPPPPRGPGPRRGGGSDDGAEVARTAEDPPEVAQEPEDVPDQERSAEDARAVFALVVEQLPTDARRRVRPLARKVVPQLQDAARRGWSPQLVAEYVASSWPTSPGGATNPPGLLRHLLDDLAQVDPPADSADPQQPARPAWCGRCNQQTRRVEHDEDGRDLGRCAKCHPLVVIASAAS